MTTSEHLVSELEAAGALPAAWREAFLGVPRHLFLPARIWVDDAQGQPQPVDRDTNPDRWWQVVYSDVPIVTQFDAGATVWPAVGTHRTSSASEPGMVARMLDCLDVHPGQRALEIGTGTGYNAALLAHQLGAGQVTTVEIDPAIAQAGKAALDVAGYPVTTVLADGAAGYPDHAPYDRVIATVAATLGALPYAWVRQTRPGGVIVAPIRTDYLGSGPLVRFTVQDGGTATGFPITAVGFMPLRQQRTRYTTPAVVDADDQDPDQRGEVSQTSTPPWWIANSIDVRWAISTRIAACRWGHRPPTGTRPYHQLWFTDKVSGSWALARYDRSGGPYQIRQDGPRRLWDEIEGAYRWWVAHGQPSLTQWKLTINSTQQTADLVDRPVTA